MTRQEFIDYMWDYGCHVRFVYGDNHIQKRAHLTPSNSYFTNFELTNSKSGKVASMSFYINGEMGTIDECVDIIKSYKRDEKLKEIGI